MKVECHNRKPRDGSITVWFREGDVLLPCKVSVRYGREDAYLRSLVNFMRWKIKDATTSKEVQGAGKDRTTVALNLNCRCYSPVLRF